MLDWNDIHAFIAVAQTGSTLAGARVLRVSQTTAARRIAALEAALGLTLFERRQQGYLLTEAGQGLLGRALAVESAASAFTDAAAAEAREVSGTVRLTTVEIYALTVLPPILRDLHAAFPTIRIELDTSDAPRDLEAGEADIALRNSKSPKGRGLVGRRIADDPWTVYCSRAYAAGQSQPHTREDLRGHVFIGGGGSGVWRHYQAWLSKYGLEDAVAMRQDTASGMLAAVRSGFGMAVLPTFLADREPDLVRVLPPEPGAHSGLWLLTHERIRHAPRVRAVTDFIAERLKRLARERLEPGLAEWAEVKGTG
ncbi:MAG: Transcriptional regulator, LysR family [Alphaproteobacteria bacterium]|nr:Transcriptional regulator, LysR family [Alphaproteobacteria bacterium]